MENNALSNEQINMQKTANTLIDLCEHSDNEYAKEIRKILEGKYKINWTRLLTTEFSTFPVSRFYTMLDLIHSMIKIFGKDLQIVELGAGFMPMSLEVYSKVGKYIEVDLDFNSQAKKEIVNQINPSKKNLFFVKGDILEKSTWKEIKLIIDLKKPVLIFSMGVIAHYFTNIQKEKIAKFSNPLLNAEGSCFIIDDTLKNHPELHKSPLINKGMQRAALISGNKYYNSDFQPFNEVVKFWKGIFPNKEIFFVDYILSKPAMDFAIKKFKLAVFLNDPKKKYLKHLNSALNITNKRRLWVN